MVKLIAGKKGSGKTKHLIETIHTAEKESKGNVVAIQYGSSLNIDIYHKIRLINIEDYKLSDYDDIIVLPVDIVYTLLFDDLACIRKRCGHCLQFFGKAGDFFDKSEIVGTFPSGAHCGGFLH